MRSMQTASSPRRMQRNTVSPVASWISSMIGRARRRSSKLAITIPPSRKSFSPSRYVPRRLPASISSSSHRLAISRYTVVRGSLRDAPVRRPAGPCAARHWEAIDFDPAGGAIRLPAHVRIDLGGTAKGLAADLAADALARHGSYAVDVGGDIRIGGSRPVPRDVYVEH